MAWGRRRYTPPIYAERSYEWAAIGYKHDDNVVIDQVDHFVRVPGTAPYDRAWQGVQKPNAISEMASASVHLGFSPSAGAGLPHGSWVAGGETANPMQYTQPQGGGLIRLFAVGASGVGTLGPGSGWPANPTAPLPTAQTYGADRPGLLRSLRNKLGI